jgi:hypothetical protein
MHLLYFHFDAVNSSCLEQAIQCATLVIVEMILTVYQIPSDSANN